MMMTIAKIKIVCLAVVAFGVLCAGAGWMALGAGAVPTEWPAAVDPKPAIEAADVGQVRQEQKAVDLYGDLLPKGAIARLGSARFRYEGRVNSRELFFLQGDKVLAASVGNTIHFWEVPTGKEVQRLLCDNWAALDFSPDGKTLALISGEITLLEVATGKQLFKVDQQVPELNARIDQIRFSPDGKSIAACYLGEDANGYREAVLLLVDVATGKIRKRLTTDDGFVFGLAFSPDSKRLAARMHGSSIVFFDVATGKMLGRIVVQNDAAVDTIAWSPDGRTLARGTTKGVELIELATGKVRVFFELTSGIMCNLAFTVTGAI